MKLDLLSMPAGAEDTYELLDSGDGEKLERFGDVVVIRPDPQALWPKRIASQWASAQGVFHPTNEGGWKFKNGIARQWPIDFFGLKFLIRPSIFKHVGLFPEQTSNWQWIQRHISSTQSKKNSVLNLFGYTGGATLAVATYGAEVTHLDGSKTAISWARENAVLSNLADAPIRWILDDARTFVRREIRRGRHYDAIILDPPAFGPAPKGEIWKIEDNFLELLELCRQVLSDQPLFFLVNGYASGYSPIGYANAISSFFPDGTLEMGELALVESGIDGRFLPAGIYARISWL